MVTDPDRMRDTGRTGRVRLRANAHRTMEQGKDPRRMLCIGTMAPVTLLANVVDSELVALARVPCMGHSGSLEVPETPLGRRGCIAREVQAIQREAGSGSPPQAQESVREHRSHVVRAVLAMLLAVDIGNRQAVLVNVPERVSHAAKEVLAKLLAASTAAPPDLSSVVTAVLARPPVASIVVLLEVLASVRECVSSVGTAVLAKLRGLRGVSSMRVGAIRRAGSTVLSTWPRVMGSRGSRSTISSWTSTVSSSP
jgi:hypothetical protein